MTTQESRELAAWRGCAVTSSSGERVGTVADIYVDDATGEPEWLAVSTGPVGTAVTFVPIQGAAREGEEIVVPYSESTIRQAPTVDADGLMSQDDEDALYAHYGFEYGEAPSDTGVPEGVAQGEETDYAMTRSEEELRVGKASREAGRVRLRKWVETETERVTVPVAREEVRVEREPITEANIDQALAGPEISEAEHEVVLHEEQAVAAKETVPKERVRLEKDVVTEEEEVGAELRKERLEVEGAAGAEPRAY